MIKGIKATKSGSKVPKYVLVNNNVDISLISVDIDNLNIQLQQYL